VNLLGYRPRLFLSCRFRSSWLLSIESTLLVRSLPMLDRISNHQTIYLSPFAAACRAPCRLCLPLAPTADRILWVQLSTSQAKPRLMAVAPANRRLMTAPPFCASSRRFPPSVPTPAQYFTPRTPFRRRFLPPGRTFFMQATVPIKSGPRGPRLDHTIVAMSYRTPPTTWAQISGATLERYPLNPIASGEDVGHEDDMRADDHRPLSPPQVLSERAPASPGSL
jgi:hypothetical protein